MQETLFDENHQNPNTFRKLRLIFLGSSQVGKTSLIHRYIHNLPPIPSSYTPTTSIKYLLSFSPLFLLAYTKSFSTFTLIKTNTVTIPT